jgi:hypothetical protein
VLMALGGLLLIVITTRRRVGVHRQAV